MSVAAGSFRATLYFSEQRSYIFIEMLNYLPSLATVLLALMQLAKDWGAHQSTLSRALVLVAIMLLGVGGAINTFYSSRRSAAQHVQDEKEISGLKKAVETASADQEKNTKVFVKSFDDMSQKLNGLETQLKTVGLQTEAARLRTDLEATRKALSLPKATFAASLGEVTDTLDNLDVKETSATQSPDGVVGFTITVANNSAVQAKNGAINVRICLSCEFAEEPKGFTKPENAPNSDRAVGFPYFEAGTVMKIPLKVKAPMGPKTRMEVDVTVRCENCTVDPKTALFVNH